MKAIESLLKRADDCELAAIDALTASAHSLTIAIAVIRGRLDIEEAVELIRLEEDLQVSFQQQNPETLPLHPYCP